MPTVPVPKDPPAKGLTDQLLLRPEWSTPSVTPTEDGLQPAETLYGTASGFGMDAAVADGRVVLTSVTGDTYTVRMPPYFRPTGLAARDLDGDGDAELLVFGASETPGEPPQPGRIAFQNLAARSATDRQYATARLQDAIQDVFSAKGRGQEGIDTGIVLAAWLRLHSPEAFATMVAGLFLARNDYDFIENNAISAIFHGLALASPASELPAKIGPFFATVLAREDVVANEMFFGALGALPRAVAVAILQALPADRIGKTYCAWQTNGRSHFISGLDGLENGVLTLFDHDPAQATQIEEAMQCHAGWRFPRFPQPGIDGFIAWERIVKGHQAAQFVNYLLDSQDPARAWVILDGLAAHPDVLQRLARSGLSEAALVSAKLYELLDADLTRALQTSDVSAFADVDAHFLQQYLERTPCGPAETARLMAATIHREEIGTLIAKHAMERDPRALALAIVALYAIDADKVTAFLSQLNGHHIAAADFLNPYAYRTNSFSMATLNPTMIYEVIKRLPADLLVACLSIDARSDQTDFQRKAAYVARLKTDRPELFPQLLHRLHGPFVGTGVPPDEAADKMVSAMKISHRAREMITKVFNSTHLPVDYLVAVARRLPTELRTSILEFDLKNYGVLRAFGKEPLKTDPRLVFGYLRDNSYHVDPGTAQQILADIRDLPPEQFVTVIQTFLAKQGSGFLDGDVLDIMQGWRYADSTGLGWIYRALRATQATDKLALMRTVTNGYLANVDFLRRQFGLDIDLYQRGPFTQPLTRNEIAPIAELLQRMPPGEINAIGGITIMDDHPGSGIGGTILGANDPFGNLVLYRRYTEEQLTSGIRIPNVPFLVELVTHEAGHTNEADLTKDEFALFVRCAGYMRTGLYSVQYEPVETRTMTSTYHTTIHEEFAEHWTHYQLNNPELRRRALERCDLGDCYLALEYLFFAHVPRETRGTAYPSGSATALPVPPGQQLTIDALRRRVVTLAVHHVVSAEKRDWILARLTDLARYQ